MPFSERSAAAGSEHGIAFISSADYEVRVFGTDGALRMLARLDESPPVRTDALLEAYATRSGTSDRDAAEIRDALERYRASPLPESLPGYTRILFTPDGGFWARRFVMPGAETARWDVFSPDGVHLGRVMVPASFRIEEIGASDVLGIARDALGVERVQILQRIPRPVSG